MTITINEINSGMGLLVDGQVYIVEEYHHVKPGKGSAFVRVKLRNIKIDSVLERTFRSSEKLEEVNLEDRDLEFLYRAGDSFHFIDHTTYEQIDLNESIVGDAARFLLENLEVIGVCLDHKVIKIIMPNFITARVVETEPGIRGDSSRAGNKPAKIETGATVLVPLFINVDDWLKIDTRSGQYVERVQK